MKMKYIEPVEMNTTIEWWNENRKRLNDVINAFNNWQEVLKFDPHIGQFIVARIDTLCKDDSFSEWQYELFEEMKTHILSCLEGDNQGS